jgi:hypothetical protein
MERNSLEHLLLHFCGVTAKKEYQNADWRSRPLPEEMIKYAREDTHYLLYIYDLMKQRLQRESTPENDLLLEVKLFGFPSYMLRSYERAQFGIVHLLDRTLSIALQIPKRKFLFH